MFMAILALIPGLSTLVSSITTAYFNAKVQLVRARIGGDEKVATQLVVAAVAAEHENTSKLSIMASNKFLTFMLIGFALPWIGYEWKVVLWDNVFAPIMLGHEGFTAAIGGSVGDWATTIIGFLFGSSTTLAVGKMWFGRNQTGE
jgi:hypothetical protein